MENMSFGDLDLLLGVIEIQMVLHIFIHGLQFPVLYCDILTYSVSFLIHSILHLQVMYNMSSCSLDHRSMLYNCSILRLVRVKFAKISFCDEFIDYSTCFLFPALLYLIIIHMVLVQKRERSFMSMLWLRPMFASSWYLFPM
jgi:hypothetical protein